MVFTKATSILTKRKKTADMPDSPPKRVTRARAKAAGDGDLQLKITTASAKISHENKREAGPANPTKRKTRADDEKVGSAVEEIIEELPKKEAKTRGRQKKVEDDVQKEQQANDGSAPRTSRSAKIQAPEEANASASKPRGRPKKIVSTTLAPSAEADLPENTGPAKRSVRGRPPTIITKPSAAKSKAKVPPTKKKVQFQDVKDNEKENLSLQANVLERPILKATGLKAKPIRRAASARSAARGRRDDGKENPADTHSTNKIHPLSPKKVTQIAKSCSVSSEDELSGEKTPTRVLCRSPVKPPMSTIREIDKPCSNLDLGPVDGSSSSNVVPPNILASPARRPPSSPFRDAFNESPKRINPGDSLVHAISVPPSSPMKTSLLKSPARRLPASPIKFNAPASPTKSGFAMPVIDTATASKKPNSFAIPHLLQEKAIRSPFKASKSPDRPFKVYKIDAAEKEADSKLKTPNTSVQENNVQDSGAEKATATPMSTNDISDLAADTPSSLSLSPSPSRTSKARSEDCENLTPEIDVEKDRTGNILQPRATVLEPTVCVAPAFSFASTGRFASEDSESEDELTMIHKSCAPTPISHGISTKYSTRLESAKNETKTNNSTAQEALTSSVSRARADACGMTPLAVQLTAWFASSPEKKTTGKFERKRGLFSPAGPTLFDRPEQAQMFGSPCSSPKSSFFDDEMAARGQDEDNAVHEQSGNEEVCMDVVASQSSQTSEEYGDENALPLDPLLQATNPTSDQILTCTPARIFLSQAREIHTVSKVPLRPAGDDSPLRVPRTRGRSVGIPLRDLKSSEDFDFEYVNDATPVPQSSNTPKVASEDSLIKEQTTSDSEVPQTPGTGMILNPGTPMRTVRKGVVPNVLKGAVVYVDVHTTEGADASGIFVDLLTQMGARCVKQWLWNPRSGTNRSGEEELSTSSDFGTLDGKVGITHVVYKDGGKRTLEKVREAKGVVLCVGVGWVLE